MRQAFPWEQALGFGFAVLRLSPAQLWSMTPRELSFAMAPFSTAQNIPTRANFDELQQLYPDVEDIP